MLDGLVDESDPDVDFPNSFHAFQTAEGIRQAHPDKGAPTCPSLAVVGEALPWGGEGRQGNLSLQALPKPVPPLPCPRHPPPVLPCLVPSTPPVLPCPDPGSPCSSSSQTGSTSWGSCTTWGRCWLWRGSPR